MAVDLLVLFLFASPASLQNNNNKKKNTSGPDSEGFACSVEPFFDSKFHFHGKYWVNLLNFGYRIEAGLGGSVGCASD